MPWVCDSMLPYRQPVDAAQLGPSSLGGYLAAMGVDVIEVEGAAGPSSAAKCALPAPMATQCLLVKRAKF